MTAYRSLLSFGAVAVGIFGVEGFRKRRSTGNSRSSFAGVPVYNLQMLESNITQEQDWIVVLDPSMTDSEIDSLCKRAKAGSCKMTGHPSAGGVPFIEVQGSPEQMEAMLEKVDGLAKYVEPNVRLNLIPDDDFIEDGMGTQSSSAWHVANIGLGSAEQTGKGVNVYVFDTGIRVTHQEFTGRAVASLDVVASPSSPVECQGDSACAKDVRGHGSHCAGLVGGISYGAATDATLHAVKVLDDSGAGPWSNIIGGLDWVARKRQRPAVLSMSLGGPGAENSVAAAVDVAVAAGITVVVAAGNSNSDACDYTPAFAPSAMAVGAIDSGMKANDFSNYGTCVNIWAPGFSILSVSPDSDTATTRKSGTSMSCPLVAGGAALILEVSPDLSPANVRAALSENAIPDQIQPYGSGGGMREGSGDVNLRLFVGNRDVAPTPAPSRRRFWFR